MQVCDKCKRQKIALAVVSVVALLLLPVQRTAAAASPAKIADMEIAGGLANVIRLRALLDGELVDGWGLVAGGGVATFYSQPRLRLLSGGFRMTLTRTQWLSWLWADWEAHGLYSYSFGEVSATIFPDREWTATCASGMECSRRATFTAHCLELSGGPKVAWRVGANWAISLRAAAGIARSRDYISISSFAHSHNYWLLELGIGVALLASEEGL